MNNADTPAMPIELNGFGQYAPEAHYGLTKREKFCLQMGVPETGDPELDDIIRKGNKQKASIAIMKGLFSGDFMDIRDMADHAKSMADALLKELNK